MNSLKEDSGFAGDSVYYIKDGIEHGAPCVMQNGVYIQDDGEVALRRKITKLSDILYRIEDEYENISGDAVEIITVLQSRCDYAPEFTLIPCVSYNGNKFGHGPDPKGMTYDGKPWVFGYSRTGLPSASISEGNVDGNRICTALFASSSDADSLISACSLSLDCEGRTVHRIFRPEIEMPVCFSSGGEYTEPFINTIKIERGGMFACTSYFVECIPESPCFGVADVYRAAFGVMDVSSTADYDVNELWRLGISYAKELVVDGREAGNNTAAFTTGLNLNREGNYAQSRGDHELGWCGQNSTLALAMIEQYNKTGDKDALELGIRVIDTWMSTANEYGFIASRIPHLVDRKDERRHNADTVNIGYGGMQLLHAYSALSRAGIRREDILASIKRLCDLLISLYSDENGMPSCISDKGESVSYNGGGGMFAGYVLTALYRETKEKKYLDMAAKLLDFYNNRDLNRFACAAGALDTSCVDKETCCPILYTALELHELTGDGKWLYIAGHAAAYLITWMYCYNVIYPDGTDFIKMGFETKGGTAVSAEHPHIDPWGAVISYDMERYARASGESMYAVCADMMWNNTTKAISDGVTPDSRGRVRPLGSQAEAYCHAHWYFGPADDHYRFGYINDWLVAWPTAHRLAVIMRRERNF